MLTICIPSSSKPHLTLNIIFLHLLTESHWGEKSRIEILVGTKWKCIYFLNACYWSYRERFIHLFLFIDFVICNQNVITRSSSDASLLLLKHCLFLTADCMLTFNLHSINNRLNVFFFLFDSHFHLDVHTEERSVTLLQLHCDFKGISFVKFSF